ncbi:MAG: hypothetical protein ABIE94_00185 [archaeon]
MSTNETEQIEMEFVFLDEEDIPERIEEEPIFDDGDIYCEEAVDLMLDDDELSAAEAAFMQGYDE